MDGGADFVDTVQTAGIAVMCGALIYVVVRLDREIKRWAATLAEVNAQLRDQASLAQRIARLEARLDAVEQEKPPP